MHPGSSFINRVDLCVSSPLTPSCLPQREDVKAVGWQDVEGRQESARAEMDVSGARPSLLSPPYADSLGLGGRALWGGSHMVPSLVQSTLGPACRPRCQRRTPEGAPAPRTALALGGQVLAAGDREHHVIAKAGCQPPETSSELKSEAAEG